MRRILLALIGALVCYAQSDQVAPNSALTAKDVELLDVIKGARKSIYVRNQGILPQPLIIELEDRQKQENRKRNWTKGARIYLAVPDAESVLQLKYGYTKYANTHLYVSQGGIAKPDLMIIDKSIVVLGANSPGTMEIIRDGVLAKSYIAEYKNDRGNKRVRPEGETANLAKSFLILIATFPKIG